MTITPSLTNARWGGSLFLSVEMATTSQQPPPLAHKPEVGVVLHLFHSRWPPHHDDDPLSLANARWGSFLLCFTQDGCYIMMTTPSRLQTQGGASFNSRQPPQPPLAHNMRWGSFFLCFTWDGHHVTTTTPSCLRMRGGGRSSFISLETAAMS
jgi:hypothetical protein